MTYIIPDGFGVRGRCDDDEWKLYYLPVLQNMAPRFKAFSVDVVLVKKMKEME